ncbi:hypothetical protein CBL_02372 [Carabus blaptoides fortunei]
MPKATLLSREALTNNSLTSIVERSQIRKPPLPEYELRINSAQLDIILASKPNQYIKPISADEGFESDIDTLSLISSDDSFTSSTCLVEDHVLKHRENDSANGSSSSESDTETVLPQRKDNENYPLSDVLCYTDVNFPKVLVFVIKDEVLVFNFDIADHLQTFYTSFNTLKAVTNQRTYGRNLGAKFNLLQRTDNNGVTHIEISREPQTKLIIPEHTESSSIISINTPEGLKDVRSVKPATATIDRKAQFRTTPVEVKKTTTFYETQPKLKSLDDSRVMLQSELRTSRSEFYPSTTINSFTLKPKLSTTLEQNRSTSKDELDGAILAENSLKKVWKSAENLLEAPKRPERRRKPKGRAPPPPVDIQKQQNVMKGQYVRVAVDPKKQVEKISRLEEPAPNFQTFSTNIQTFTPNWNSLRQPQSPLVLSTKPQPPYKVYQNVKVPDLKKSDAINMNPKGTQSWTNSVPRLLRKPRSKSETRHATPIAYRYIDTTKPQNPGYTTNSQTISNRLFGLSQKLKEFGNNVVSNNSRNFNYYDATNESRRSSLGEMSYKVGGTESSLKSVIKKQDDRRSKNGNEQKKVTFSAYATVQVV